MRLSGIQKLTLLDFPGKTAATVFTPGCNFRCPFCHNAELVEGAGAGGAEMETAGAGNAGAGAETSGGAGAGAFPVYPVEEFFALLEKRQGLLDGVCITGGEPLLQPDLAAFCARIKDAGFAVKLDTNGAFPDRLAALVDAGLVDYVAMDVKNAPDRYVETVGVPGFDLAPVRASVDYLLSGAVAAEFRTTVVRELHTADNLHALAAWIKGAPAWFLQSFIDAEGVLAGPGRLHAWDPGDLRALLPNLQTTVPNTQLRGID